MKGCAAVVVLAIVLGLPVIAQYGYTRTPLL